MEMGNKVIKMGQVLRLKLKDLQKKKSLFLNELHLLNMPRVSAAPYP
jgi:hypothetical protein